MKSIEVYIDQINQLNQTFSYQVNLDQYNQLSKGSLVIVEFNGKLKIGLVDSVLSDQKYTYKLKSIIAIFNLNPLNEYQKELMNYVDQKNYGSQIDKYNLFLIYGNKVKIDLLLNDKVTNQEIKYSNLTFKEKKVLNYDDYYIEVLISKNIKDQTINYLQVYSLDTSKLTIRQKQVFDYIEKYSEIKVSELKKELKVSQSVIDKLIFNQNIKVVSKQRAYQSFSKLAIEKEIKLNIDQKIAVDEIEQDKRVSLLFGVSGSGKTEVLIEYLKRNLNHEMQAVIILPEISLSYQMISRIEQEFNDVIIYHNQLSDGQKVAFNKQIKNNQKHIVVGTKEAIFLPFNNLQIIAIDEEQDLNYKNRGKIKYHLRDYIDYFSNMQLKVILMSATPSLESYFRAQRGYYQMSMLTSRYHTQEFPTIKFIDYNPTEVISSVLSDLIKVNKQVNRPSLIYYNKKDYAKTIECSSCYHIQKCPNCNTSLSYKKEINQQKCKFCSWSSKFNHKCLKCQGMEFVFSNIGIEQFSELIQEQFPDLKIKTIDSNMHKDKIYNTLLEYQNKKIDILIGTQIISKGIDFIDIANIYIVNIDYLLFSDEIKSFEHTYQLLEQLSGRAGRNLKYSEVYIETHHNKHFVMQAIEQHRYQNFYDQEIKYRYMTKSVPYLNVCKIEFQLNNQDLLIYLIKKFSKQIKSSSIIISEINIPYVAKIGINYRKYIIIKYKKQNINQLILNNQQELLNNKVKMIVDLNIDYIGM